MASRETVQASKKAILSGIEKTAILMNVLGKEKSFEIMKAMSDSDLRRLLNVMGNMKKAPIQIINSVLREFLHRISERDEIIFDEPYNQAMISEGLGEERAKQIFGSIKAINLVNRKQLSVLESVDSATLAEFLVEEHPQTIALVVSHMELPKQINMIRQLPDSLRPEVILRMASLEYVHPEKVEELDEVLKKELLAAGKTQNQFGGVPAVADLVNSLDKKTMNSLMARLEGKDPILAEEIRQHMFTFTDIQKIDDRGIQLILRDVPGDKLILALKSAPDELRDKIFGGMSARAAEMLKEDLSALGPQKVSEVEAAQREVVNIVKRLQEEGKIVLGGGEEAEVIP